MSAAVEQRPARACAVERWIATGGRGHEAAGERVPRWPPGDVLGRLEGVGALVAAASSRCGAEVTVDVGAELRRRSSRDRQAPSPRVSVGGRCRLLRAVDGWIAISLARASDVEAVPALLRRRRVSGDVWGELEAHASVSSAGALVERAQLLGIAAGEVPRSPCAAASPWSFVRLGAPARATGRGTRPPLVVNLAALWAGPLAAHLLWRSGAEVVTVEDAARRDGARVGDPALFERLHRGHEMVTIELATASGREQLIELVRSADVVVEGSRPRALGALGLDPAEFCSAVPGRTWLSINGYGRSGARANWTAFGDDAAAAAGVVSWDASGEPGFCGDALADPVAGLCGAAGALVSMAAGGGHLVDTSMVTAAAFVAGGRGCPLGHRLRSCGGTWSVSHVPVEDEPQPRRHAPNRSGAR